MNYKSSSNSSKISLTDVVVNYDICINELKRQKKICNKYTKAFFYDYINFKTDEKGQGYVEYPGKTESNKSYFKSKGYNDEQLKEETSVHFDRMIKYIENLKEERIKLREKYYANRSKDKSLIYPDFILVGFGEKGYEPTFWLYYEANKDKHILRFTEFPHSKIEKRREYEIWKREERKKLKEDPNYIVKYI